MPRDVPPVQSVKMRAIIERIDPKQLGFINFKTATYNYAPHPLNRMVELANTVAAEAEKLTIDECYDIVDEYRSTTTRESRKKDLSKHIVFSTSILYDLLDSNHLVKNVTEVELFEEHIKQPLIIRPIIYETAIGVENNKWGFMHCNSYRKDFLQAARLTTIVSSDLLSSESESEIESD